MQVLPYLFEMNYPAIVLTSPAVHHTLILMPDNYEITPVKNVNKLDYFS